MVLNVVLRSFPSSDHAAMQTTATRAAIRPYSIAVTPDSSWVKFARIARKVISPRGFERRQSAVKCIDRRLIRAQFSRSSGIADEREHRLAVAVEFDAADAGDLGEGGE
jgi:hypothetical protein